MKNTNLISRPPIVVILGHVDHGKTTLLDTIRKTNIASREAGGITQKIGASVVTTPEGKKITFIDTPGHAAFANMRSRGAKVADIAVLVVAANEGVKPQTKEALEYIIGSKIPYIVAATKIDLSGASSEIVKSELSKEGVMFEGSGGDVPLIEVSARKGVGIKEVLETISLLSELNNIIGDPEAALEAQVIETSKEKSGPSVSVVVRNGTIKVGDQLITEGATGKVRGLFNETGSSVKSAGPGEPVKVLGFSDLPPAGSRVWSQKGEVLPVAVKKEEMTKTRDQKGKLNLIIKAQSTGSLEAALANLPKDVSVISSSVGDITESDVFLAKSSQAFIFGFETKIPSSVTKLAETEGVTIESFNIIYRLFERIDEILKSEEVEILGLAQVIASFPYEGRKVAGCKIIQGRINKKDTLSVKRGEKELGEVKVISIKKGKENVEEVKQGEECGIFFAPQLDFKLSDMLISVRKVS